MNQLQTVISRPMAELRFRDFKALRVGGKDQYSRLGIQKLQELIEPSDCERVTDNFGQDEKSIATAYRWICRGLSVDKAIRKVKTDREIAQNAKLYSEDCDYSCHEYDD